MRKLILRFMVLMLILIPCAAFGATTQFSDFQIHRRYVPDAKVKIGLYSAPYYGDAVVSAWDDLYFTGTLSSWGEKLPYMVVTLADEGENSGIRSLLSPDHDEYRYEDEYDVYGYWRQNKRVRDIHYDFKIDTKFKNKNVNYNIPSSPVVAGRVFAYGDTRSKKIRGSGLIVPYVQIDSRPGGDDDNPTTEIYGINVSFCTLDNNGNWLEEVKGVKNVKVEFSVREQDHDEFPPILKDFPTFEGTKEIPFDYYYGDDFYITDENDLSDIKVSYELENESEESMNEINTYEWTFTVGTPDFEDIYFGDLALDKQPITIRVGDKKKFEVRWPAGYSESSIKATNPNILKVDTGEMKTWDNSASLSLTGLVPGRTTLQFDLAGRKAVREIRIVNADGKLPESATNSTGITPFVKTYTAKVPVIDSKINYSLAKLQSLTLGLKGYKGSATSGYVGIVKGTKSQVFKMEKEGDEFYTEPLGLTFDTADSTKNSEASNLDDNFTDASIWWEFEGEEDNSRNLHLTSLELSLSNKGDLNRIDTQKTDVFVPYFEAEGDESYKWKFVRFGKEGMDDAGATAAEGLSINDIPQDSKGGTFEGIIEKFQYNVKNITYVWNFEHLDTDKWQLVYDFKDYYYRVKVGESITPKGTINEDFKGHVKAISIVADNETFATISPKTLTVSNDISFTVKGVKVGDTSMYLLYEMNDDYPDKYLRQKFYVSVYDKDPPIPSDINSSDVSVLECRAPELKAYIAGDEPYYYSSASNNTSKDLTVRFMRKNVIKDNDYDSEQWNSIKKSLIAKVKVKDSEKIYEISPDIDPDDFDDTKAIHYVYYDVSSVKQGQTIEMTFDQKVNKNPKPFTYPTDKTVLSPSEQRASLKPYVKLYRTGLNIDSFEWYFVDGSDKKVDSPAEIGNVKVYIQKFNADKDEDISTEKSGSYDINFPGTALRNIRIEYEKNGIIYTSVFEPVGDPDSELNSSTFKWSISNDVPLVMSVGSARTITLTADPSIENPLAFIGNSDLVKMETLSNSGNSVTVNLVAKAPGMTTITLGSSTNGQIAYPREIWIAKNEGTKEDPYYIVPGLIPQGVMQKIIGDLKYSDKTGNNNETPAGWFEEVEYDQISKDVGIKGLSVRPKFSLPNRASDAAFSEMEKFIYGLDTPYDLLRLEDPEKPYVQKDALEIFNTLSADMISADPAQLVAVVLPEITVKYDAIYMFSIPNIDNINLHTPIFWNSKRKTFVASANLDGVSTPEEFKEDFDDDIVFLTEAGILTNEITQHTNI